MKQIAMTIAGVSLVAAGAQGATFTAISDPSGSEASHEDIFEVLFGEDFSASGLNFVSSSHTMTRIDDDKDHRYSFGDWKVKALFSDAGLAQAFGTDAAGKLVDVVGSRGPVVGTASGSSAKDVAFGRFGTRSNSTGKFTDPTLNPNGADHVITYSYVNDQDQTVYLLFFEDIQIAHSDTDYNDLVLEVTSVAVAPEPTSLALLGLGGLAMLRRRR